MGQAAPTLAVALRSTGRCTSMESSAHLGYRIIVQKDLGQEVGDQGLEQGPFIPVNICRYRVDDFIKV